MQSVRWRLTLSYAFALTASFVVFGAALLFERRASALREREDQLGERLELEAAFARQTIEDRARFLPRLVVQTPDFSRPGDSIPDLTGEVRAFLDGAGWRDLLFVMDRSGSLIYVSAQARGLDPEALNAVRRALLREPLTWRTGHLILDDAAESHRFLIAPFTGESNEELRALLVAARPDGPLSGPSALLISMLLMAPLVLVASWLLGYWLATRSLEPVDVMIGELEAIQDGRSLHRRLAVPGGEDEITRLGRTLNATLDRVERSFVALRRFTADASHELKTPLMVLRAGIERSLTHPEAPAEVVDTLDESLRQLNEMTEMVTNLLTLARADEGRSSLLLQPTDLRPLVEEAAETAEILGAGHGVAVSVDFPSDAVVAHVEGGRIRQLLLNLAINAVKYTPEGGLVSIRLESAEGQAMIEVRDTGIGIAPGDLAHVFERFWRADLARSRAGGRPGVGLGLAISRWIAEAHSGTIEVQSRPGRGSTFTVRLPLVDQGMKDEAGPEANV